MNRNVSKVSRVSKCLWALFFLNALFSCSKTDTDSKQNEFKAEIKSNSENLTTMTLFFPKMDGTGIIKVETQVADLKKSPAEWLRQMMDQLSKAPNSEVAAVFSEKVELYSLFSEKDLLYLDFSSIIQKSFFPNIQLEQLAFEAFLASLKANFPFANQAKFLVEHEDVQQIWGHIYSQQPFTL